MLKKTLIAAVVLSLGVLYAQEDRPRRERGERTPDALQEALGLSEDQVAALRQIQTDWRENARTTFGEIREKQQQLREELRSDSPDSVLVGQLMVDSQALQRQIGESREALNEQAVAVLDETQRAQLAELQGAAELFPAVAQARGLSLIEGGERGNGFRGGFGRGGGRGGFGGPGGPGGRGGPDGRRGGPRGGGR